MIKVSVLIVTYKREALLLNCLNSLRQLEEFFDLELILFVNGQGLNSGAYDEIQSKFKSLTVLEEKRVTPGVARNKAMKMATGDWIFFIDDDASLPEGYGASVFKIFSEHGDWESFGGPDAVTKNSDTFQQSLAIALSSPFCTGPTYRRHSPQNKDIYLGSEKDLTSCHLWVKRDAVQRNGIIFAEEFHRGEETTFLQDLACAGISLWVVPRLWVFHERRKTFSELLRPLFYGGYYRSAISPRLFQVFALPSLMVLGHGLLFFKPLLFILLFEIYFCLVAIISFGLCLRAKKIKCTPYVIVLHYVMVTLYGMGYLFQRIQRIISSNVQKDSSLV